MVSKEKYLFSIMSNWEVTISHAFNPIDKKGKKEKKGAVCQCHP